MKVLVYVIIATLLTLLESSLLSFFPFEFFKPDFGMPFVIYTTLFLGPYGGLITAVITGVVQEMFSGSPAGSILFTNVSVFITVTFLRNKLFIDSKYSFAYICAGSVVLATFLYLALSFISKGETGNVINILFYTLPNAIFTGFCAIFIFSLIEALNARYLDRE